jgi:HAD superfamily hydrolase (TIGR01509 family)
VAQRLEGLRSAGAVDDPLSFSFQGVVFDVDGTLVDSNDAHAKAFVEAFRESGFEIPFETVRRLIGKGSDKLIPELIDRYDPAIAKRKTALFMERYLPTVRAFPGVELLLQKLKTMKLRLAVASSAAEDELDALLEIAHAKRYFEARTDADDAERSKPDPDIVQAALQRLGLPRERCVMVGDTPYDAQAARGAGVAFVGVRCGGWRDADLQPALGVYQDPADLLANVDSWLGPRRYRDML